MYTHTNIHTHIYVYHTTYHTITRPPPALPDPESISWLPPLPPEYLPLQPGSVRE